MRIFYKCPHCTKKHDFDRISTHILQELLKFVITRASIDPKFSREEWIAIIQTELSRRMRTMH